MKHLNVFLVLEKKNNLSLLRQHHIPAYNSVLSYQYIYIVQFVQQNKQTKQIYIISWHFAHMLPDSLSK